jgi:hypothetical protein
LRCPALSHPTALSLPTDVPQRTLHQRKQVHMSESRSKRAAQTAALSTAGWRVCFKTDRLPKSKRLGSKFSLEKKLKLKIVEVQGHGKQAEEYIKFSVVDDCNLTEYLLTDTTFQAGNTVSVSNKLRHMHWFPSQKVEKGDVVYLWTGSGTETHLKQANGTTIHTLYWRLKEPVWNDNGDGALLFQISNPQSFKVR